jgi:hypothetical protein
VLLTFDESVRPELQVRAREILERSKSLGRLVASRVLLGRSRNRWVVRRATSRVLTAFVNAALLSSGERVELET